MKKGLLLFLSYVIVFGAIAQTESLPNGVRRAHVPEAYKKMDKVPYRNAGADNGTISSVQTVARIPSAQLNNSLADFEDLAGYTFYDLQTNNAISNRIVYNSDGTISFAWTFSPDAIQSTSPIFPNRGTGYNYYNTNTGIWNFPGGPGTRIEAIRTGFTNIVVTPAGVELAIAHSADAGNLNKISVARRPTKGTGSWTQSFPWGPAHDTWPKAVSALNSETVYCIFQGSGAGDTVPKVDGQQGPLYFTKSTDAGLTWSAKMLIPQIDSTHYTGFGGDSYSIDAIGDTVAIAYSDTYIDVGLLISYDGGANWTKKIIQKHPIPFYDDTLTWGIAPDSVIRSNSGDAKVLIDHNGMCHVFFSGFDYRDDSADDGFYTPFDGTDALYYWNENMDVDTGGARSYVLIATAQDFSGNDTIDVPVDTFTNCTARRPWGNYGGGITQMPSAGIDASGRIYLTYQTVAEFPEADTTFYHALHRHVYMIALNPPYDPTQWSYPYDIVPSVAEGGAGFDQEAVFAGVARTVTTHAHVLYQRDNAPGHALAADGTCDKLKNNGFSSDLIYTAIDINNLVGINSTNANDLFVSQNYPNPVRNQTSISIGLKKSSNVRLEVRDLLGKTLISETKGHMPAGSHILSLNVSKLTPGIYTYTVTAGGMKTTRKMIVQ